MNKQHDSDHAVIAEAIEEQWLDCSKMLVHLARDHGLRVADVTNAGIVPLVDYHNKLHGKTVHVVKLPRRRGG